MKKLNSPGELLTLSAGQTMADIALQLTPQTKIFGKVLDEDGDPVANATVKVMRVISSNGKMRIVTAAGTNTDEAGEYKIASVDPLLRECSPPPTNMIEERTCKAGVPVESGKPDEQAVTTYYPGANDTASATQIEIVAEHDHPGIDIHLRKSLVYRASGRVTGNAGEYPLHSLRVVMVPGGNTNIRGSGSGVSADLAKHGSFQIRGVEPGSYSVAVTTTQGMMSLIASQPLEITNKQPGRHNASNAALSANRGHCKG